MSSRLSSVRARVLRWIQIAFLVSLAALPLPLVLLFADVFAPKRRNEVVQMLKKKRGE